MLNISRSIESRIVDLSNWTKVEWNRILKLPDYAQLFNRSRKKLHKDKIDKDVHELLRGELGRIVCSFYFTFTVYVCYSNKKNEFCDSCDGSDVLEKYNYTVFLKFNKYLILNFFLVLHLNT